MGVLGFASASSTPLPLRQLAFLLREEAAEADQRQMHAYGELHRNHLQRRNLQVLLIRPQVERVRSLLYLFQQRYSEYFQEVIIHQIVNIVNRFTR